MANFTKGDFIKATMCIAEKTNKACDYAFTGKYEQSQEEIKDLAMIMDSIKFNLEALIGVIEDDYDKKELDERTEEFLDFVRFYIY